MNSILSIRKFLHASRLGMIAVTQVGTFSASVRPMHGQRYIGRTGRLANEESMKLGMSLLIIIATLFCAELTSPARLSGQSPRYKEIDLGTSVGPQSYLNVPIQFARILNNSGAVAGWADTSTPDHFLNINPNFCFDQDCWVSKAAGGSTLQGDKKQHSFLWEGGVLKDLGTFGGRLDNAIAISDAGEVVGWASVSGDQAQHAFLWNKEVGKTHPTQLSITSAEPPPGDAGAPYSASLTASGGKTPYTWTWIPVEGSTLPPGLTVLTNPDNSGTISGTPTVTGSFNVVVQLTDVESAQTTVNYTLTINSPGSLAITSGSPPEGTVGTTYGGLHIYYGHEFRGFPLTAAGVAPNLQTWSWAAAPGSSLPPGLTLTSNFYGGSTRCCVYIFAITGVPTVPGSYDVVVTVTDSASPSTELSANYTIEILGP